MILYHCLGPFQSFYTVFPIELGSAVFSLHATFHAAIAACIFVALSKTVAYEERREWISHPSVYFSGFSSSLGFLLVYRANLAYQRYWEARTRICQMGSKLRDVATQVATFVQSNDSDSGIWKSTMLRRLALYNAVALMELRTDSDDISYMLELVQEGVLIDGEMEVLKKSSNRPSLIMVWLNDAWVTRNVRPAARCPPTYPGTRSAVNLLIVCILHTRLLSL
eukprot:COSAG05_NODE_3400_length_2085_cov_3.351964_1_plen_223_part_00